MTLEKITPRQLAAARIMLGLSGEKLGEAIGRTCQTVYDLECGKHPRSKARPDLVRELEERGIRFLENGIQLAA